MVSQDMRLGHIILASDDSRLKDQMQADAPVEKIGPVYRDLRLLSVPMISSGITGVNNLNMSNSLCR